MIRTHHVALVLLAFLVGAALPALARAGFPQGPSFAALAGETIRR